ncbi:MAG: hypothetical protein IPM82_22490 [Saprospiraceae bacterium]|nr:hypothetical protein [Saprospiraceae bacterium]
MKNHWKILPTAFVVLLLPQFLFGQKTANFAQLLDQAGLEVFKPLDAGYRAFQPLENEYLNCQYAIHSNREDLQICYYVLPWNETDHATVNPHVATFRVLTSVASNADEAVISAIQPDREALIRDFNADWGMAYFFRPKPAFAQAPNCKMLALSKEGQGTVFVFFLFDDPGNLALDRRELAVRFR